MIRVGGNWAKATLFGATLIVLLKLYLKRSSGYVKEKHTTTDNWKDQRPFSNDKYNPLELNKIHCKINSFIIL